MDHNFKPMTPSMFAQLSSLLNVKSVFITVLASMSTTPLELFASKVTNKLFIKAKDFPILTLFVTISEGLLCSITQYQLLISLLKQSSLILMTLSYLSDYSFITLNELQFPSETVHIVIYFLKHINHNNFLIHGNFKVYENTNI